MNFAEYYFEASFNQFQGAVEPSYEELRDFWGKYGGSYVKFKDWHGGVQIGKLAGLHDEGVFLVKTRDGQTHDVFMNMIIGVLGKEKTPMNQP